jgi:hypothetical protein
MADVEVLSADMADGRVTGLRVRFKQTAERTIDRATALAWLADGHSLIACSGAGHHPLRGRSIERVEVDGEPFLRSDTLQEAVDALVFPAAHGH